jgi:hypothetical protein
MRQCLKHFGFFLLMISCEREESLPVGENFIMARIDGEDHALTVNPELAFFFDYDSAFLISVSTYGPRPMVFEAFVKQPVRTRKIFSGDNTTDKFHFFTQILNLQKGGIYVGPVNERISSEFFFLELETSDEFFPNIYKLRKIKAQGRTTVAYFNDDQPNVQDEFQAVVSLNFERPNE